MALRSSDLFAVWNGATAGLQDLSEKSADWRKLFRGALSTLRACPEMSGSKCNTRSATSE